MADKMEHDFTFKGKPSVEADIKPSKEDLEFIQKVEKKFEKNTAINSEEIVKYFEVTKTQIRSKLLKDVLSIGNVWVRKRDGVYGQGFQNIQETPKDPNRRKKSVQEAFKKAIESAMETTKQLREESVSLSQVKQESGEEEKLAKELESINETNDKLFEQHMEDMKDVQGFGFGTDSLPNPASVSRNDWLKEYMPNIMRGTPNFKFDQKDLDTLASAFGEDNPFASDSPLMQLMQKYSMQSDLHDINWSEGVRALFEDKSEATKMMLEQISKEAEVELDQDIISDPIDFKPLSTAFVKYLPKYLEKNPEVRDVGDIKQLLATSEAVLDPLEYAIKVWEKSQGKKKSKSVKKKPKSKDTAITLKEAIKEIEPKAEEDSSTQQTSVKAEEDVARKTIEDAINPLTEDIIESISNEAPDTSSGSGGGSRKPPKTAKGSDDGSDDGGDDYEDSFDNEDFNPRRYFKAQVENLQRSFNSKLFGESESTLFSSLQKTFERGSRVEDLNDLEKLIDQETRLQSKILKDFETSNQNTANLLQAKAEEMIVREQGKSEEDRDDNLINWLNERLDEIKSVREATTTEFNRIQKQIETEIRDNAMKGFESGVIEREMSKEQKILTKFTKEFGKYVNKEHDRLAKEQAYETSKAYIEDNPKKLPAEELLKKAQKLYDKEYATYMSNAPKEPALTDKEIVKSYEDNKETFTPDAFKVKNAPIGFGEKSKYDPTEDDYVSPEKRSLGELVEDPKRRKAIQKNLMVWGAIKGSTAPMVQASSNPTGQGAVSNAAGNASAGAFALNAIGKAGPYGMLIAASLQTVSILGEIADNTAKNVQAFSPDVMMASVENQLLRLNQNIGIGNERGAKLADYQKSQGTLSRQMYELGVELFSILQPFIVLTVDFINNLLAILNFILMLVGSIVSLIEPVIAPMIKFLKESSEGWAALMNWIKGRRNQIPNYTEEFMQNDPRQHIKHI